VFTLSRFNSNVSKEVKDKIKTFENTLQTVSKGSPKGVYATLSALQTALPTGDTNIYVVTADGKWYYWSGTAWTAGGTYQATGIAKGQIKPTDLSFIKLDTAKNMFDGVYQKQYLNGTSGALTLANQDGRLAMFILEPNSTYSIAVSPDISTTLKIATAKAPVSVGGTFDGATNTNTGTKTRLVTVTDDIYMYVSAAPLSPTADPYLKVVKSNVAVPVAAGEKIYPYSLDNIDMYSKGEVDNKISQFDTKLLATRKVKVIKTGEIFKVYVPSKKSLRYTCYTFSRDVNASKNLDIWRITKIEVTDQSLNVLYLLCSGYDVDGVVKIAGENDYTGGYHGYETMKDIFVLADGVKKEIAADFDLECERFKIIVQSETYVRTTTNKNFDKFKTLEFTRDGVHIFSKYVTAIAATLEIARLCLLSIEKMSGNVKLLSYHADDSTVIPVDVKPEAESTNGSNLVIDDKMKSAELFSDELYVRVWRGDSTEINNRGSIVDFVTRLKPYLDPMRDTSITVGQTFYCNSYYEIYS
jgi:hypothetical protein